MDEIVLLLRILLRVVKVFGPLIIVCVLPWIVAWLAGRLARRFGRRSRPCRRAVFLAGVLCQCYLLLFATGLPSDAEMIAHFRAHRGEFEESVRRYRDYELPRGVDHSTGWLKQDGTQELLRKAGIERIAGGSMVWLPNPYSVETAKKQRAMSRDPQRPSFAMPYKYGELAIWMTPRERYFVFNSLRIALVWKNYFHLPEAAPRIEDGWMLSRVDTKGKSFRWRSVVSSTDRFPLVWKLHFGCVIRPIEPHWYLQLCSGR
jgi:hypothetical protein